MSQLSQLSQLSSDPRAVPAPGPLLDRAARRLLRDPRDLTLLRPLLVVTVTLLPSAVLLFVLETPPWWLVALHLALYLALLPPVILAGHNFAHRKIWRRDLRWMSGWAEWLVGPLAGLSPFTYSAHHVEMHHREENRATDLSTTRHLHRDSILAFLRYFGRFLFFGIFELSFYLARRRRWRALTRTVVGEATFLGAAALLFVWFPVPALAVLVVPLLVTRFLMMAGNWGQHAFIDPADPDNPYRNTITCIDCGYNRRAFNDGYHIGHHLHPAMHWTELPAELERNRSTYASEGAIVFRGIDFFIVWLALMTKRYRFLARRLVDLGHDSAARDPVEMLRSRTRRIDG